MAAYFQDPRERNNEIVGKTPTKLTSHGRLLAMVEKHSPPDHLQKKFMDLYRLGSLEGATTVAEELVVSFSHSPFSWKALGNCLLRSGDYDSARNALETACDLDPSDILALSSLAWTLFKQGELKSAIKLQKDCLELEPSNAQSQFTMASILYHSGSGDDALKHLNEALHLGHSEAEVLSMRSAIYSLSLRFQEGFDDIERLYELAPDDPTVLNNLGNFYKDMANFSKARYFYARALEINPQHMHAYSNILLNMHYDPSETAENILDMAKSWQHRNSIEAEDKSYTRSKGSASRNIRVGLVSSNFRKHPVGWMISSALKNLPDDIDIIIFSDSDRHDFITQEIKNSSSEWRSVYHLSDSQLANNIYENNIDILIDLAGHGSNNRLHTMAAHPAPLVIKWVGSQVSSMGIPAFDYFLSDSIETPPGVDHLYTEKLIRLPDDYICYLVPYYKPAITPLPSIQNQYVTLGCFNNPTKVNDDLLEEWATLMRDLPASRLILKGAQYSNPEVCTRILNVMGNAGVSADRIILEGPVPHDELLKSYQRVDIALDTWPYSGGLTTCEALMMGVPVVTLPGPTFAGRHSATHLINAGMPELVVESWKEYRQRVIELASDLPSLAVIRASLRTYLEQSPLCDGQRFGQHLHKALRAIWQRYCDHKAPAALTFNKEGKAQFEDEQAPVEIHYADAPEDDSAFQWQFDGKLIAVDNGGQLLEKDIIWQLLQKEAIELIAFDPSSRALDTSLKQHKGVHYYPNVTLGDGRPSQLHACLDPKMSSSLKPLNDEYQPEDIRKGSQVLTKLPLNSIALDSIEGIPAIDWLVLDDLNDISAILDNGAKALEDTLLLQVKVVFQSTHERQPNLAEIQHWAIQNGFRFYRLHELQYRSHLPEEVPKAQHQASELTSADALFLPSVKRMKTLSEEQRTRLAFLLHTAFNITDITFEILNSDNEKTSKNYLEATGLLERNKSKPQRLKNVQDIIKYLEKARLKKSYSNHKLPGKLVVSLTSYKARFNNLYLTLRSLLLQETQPDLLIIWIAKKEKNDIPDNIWELTQYGLNIRFCEDIRSYKKIIPTLEEHPDSFIVTADDDLYYEPDWLKKLLASWDGSYKTVTAHRAHKIRLDQKGNPVPYRSWKWQVGPEEVADGLIFPTSGAGALYPPRVFHEDVTKSELFTKLCPDADDIWLYWMVSLKSAKVKRSDYNFKFIEWPRVDKNGLWEANIFQQGNDKKLKKIAAKYGKPWNHALLHKNLKTNNNPKTFSYDNRGCTTPPSSPSFYLEANGKKIAYTYIRKNACSAFKELFKHYSDHTFPSNKNPIETMLKYHKIESAEEARKTEFQVAVLRNPYERIASLYKNKFIQRIDHEDIFENFRKVTGQNPDNCTFKFFIENYLSNSFYYLDPHTYTQKSHLLPIEYNHIILMENLMEGMSPVIGEEASWSFFEKRLNTSSTKSIEIPNAHKKTSRDLSEMYKSEGIMATTGSFLNEEIRRIIYTIYKEDVDLIERIKLENN